MEATVATLKAFTLGPLELRDVPAEFHSSGAGSFRTLRLAGLVGAGVRGRFRVIFDRPHAAMYLLPPTDGARPTFPKDRAGLQTYFRGRYLEILFVAPGSPGEAGGWKAGDQIVAIDGAPIAPSHPTLPAWQSRPPGTKVLLKDGRGAIRPLTLRDYY
jgi:membrane-associated protease RseP (regulator of RpoE activity)